MAKINYAVGPCFKGVGPRWQFPVPPTPPDPERENFYAFAAEAGAAVFQQVTLYIAKLCPTFPEPFHPDVPAVAAEIVNHGLKISLAFDLLDPARKGLLNPECVPW